MAGRETAETFTDFGPSRIWYGLAMLFGAIPALEALFQWLTSPVLLIQDDARQFVFWMRRWIDPDLFPGDRIADYFQSVSPMGFASVYQGLAFLGLDPFVTNRLLPLLLGLILAHYGFRLTHLLAQRPGIAFLGSALTSFFIWLVNPVASGTPRAFAVPVLLAFLFHLADRRIIGIVVTALVSGLFYPQMALIIGGVLVTCLVGIDSRGRLRLALDGRTRATSLFGLIAVSVGLAPFAWRAGGEAISKAQAMAAPAFQPGGRSAFFVDRADWFFLCNERSGFLPVEWGCHSLYDLGSSLAPVLAVVLLIIVVVPAAGLLRGALRPEVPEVRRFAATIPLRLLAVSVAGFALAHLFLFDLHLPSRFGQYPLRAITFVALAAWAVPVLHRRGAAKRIWRDRIGQAVALLAALALVPFPFVPRAEYVAIKHPDLHAALSEMPKDTVVAALGDETDNIPSAAARSIYVSREILVPWSKPYGEEMRRRMSRLIDAVYAIDNRRLADFVRTEGVGTIVSSTSDFSPGHLETVWWRTDFPDEYRQIRKRVDGAAGFALLAIWESCTDVKIVGDHRLVPASCFDRRRGGNP